MNLDPISVLEQLCAKDPQPTSPVPESIPPITGGLGQSGGLGGHNADSGDPI